MTRPLLQHYITSLSDSQKPKASRIGTWTGAPAPMAISSVYARLQTPDGCGSTCTAKAIITASSAHTLMGTFNPALNATRGKSSIHEFCGISWQLYRAKRLQPERWVCAGGSVGSSKQFKSSVSTSDSSLSSKPSHSFSSFPVASCNSSLASIDNEVPIDPNPDTYRPSTNSQLLILDPSISIPTDIDPVHAGQYCATLIFDLGDVLFTWSAETESAISSNTLRKIIRSATWFEYEKGMYTESEAYSRVAAEFGVAYADVKRAIQGARASVAPNEELVAFIRELKSHSKDHEVKIFGMSNITMPDWEVLQTKGRPEDWLLFERVFTSAEAMERKPNLGFYQHVIREITKYSDAQPKSEVKGHNLNWTFDPTSTIFVDDKLENVVSARSCGLRGLQYTSFEILAQSLRNAILPPLRRAHNWLRANAKNMPSITNTDVVLHENFSQLLILEATGERDLVEFVEHPRLFNFFQDNCGVVTTEDFPYDLDTTSVGLSVCTHVDALTKHSVMDEMLTYRNADGIAQIYFDHKRPRIDPIACTNVLSFFYAHGRGHELPQAFAWVHATLQHRAYLDGTLYYYGGDTFLFFLSRLLEVSPSIYEHIAPLFSKCMLERVGKFGDALAMRIIAACTVHVEDALGSDIQKLKGMQEVDGGWPVGWIYKYDSDDILIGNCGLTTALAMKALELVEKSKKK